MTVEVQAPEKYDFIKDDFIKDDGMELSSF